MNVLRRLLVIAVCILSAGGLFAQFTVKDIHDYIDKYKELAISKMYDYKIPASITLAQGILESGAGTSRLAVQGNNHFGIKCHNDWSGDTILVDDDELQECFRKYEKVEDSYNDHSLFLKNRKRYQSLFELDVLDYAGWAHGLKAAGYATNPEYAPLLIGIIEKYNLAALDTLCQQRIASGYYSQPQPAEPSNTVNDAKVEDHSTDDSGSYITPPSKKPHAVTQKPKPSRQEPSQASSKKDEPAPVRNEKPVVRNEKPATEANANRTQGSAQPSPVEEETPTEQSDVPVVNADGASEQAVVVEKPTADAVFSAVAKDYPKGDYPFTDRQVYVNNKTLFVIAQMGDSYASLARDVQTSEKSLKSYNDVSGTAKLKIGQVVYIERKSKYGEREYYKVVNEESLLYISQKTGVRLDCICQYNGLKPDSKVKKGDVIKLRK